MACLAPRKQPDGSEVACRECKQCLRNLRNAWVGRNIAESKTNKFCYWITGTYGRGKVGEVLHERAVILTYSDVQKLLKLLLRHGYDVRRFVTGEYGSERGRAHWNILLYSNKPLPPFAGWDQYGKWKANHRMKTRFNWVRVDAEGKPVMLQNKEPAYWWPHGFVQVEGLSPAGVQYVCKYVTKDFDKNGRQGHKGQSKRPPIGTAWFRQMAEKYVKQGLAPQTPGYRFPEVRTKDGAVVDYWLTGRPLEMYLDHYIETWASERPNQPRPKSDLVDLYEQYGKVVFDEDKMLLRQQFPNGEGRAKFPSAEWIKREAEDALYERAVRDYSYYDDDLRDWHNQWVDEAEDGEERQRRQAECATDRVQQWYAFNHRKGRHWYSQGGWQRSQGRSEPCSCCHGGEPEAQHAEPDSGDELAPDCGLGKVGKWNALYGGPKLGPGMG